MSDPKKEEGSASSDDDVGVGMRADGTLNVIKPEDLPAAIAARNAWEAEEPGAGEDISDLDELDELAE